MSNRLKNETSPYLIQHAENPVDWYPWCGEAFDKARREDKPVFLSIGYSTCHWCHVMAHESFEDEITAEILNKNYVSIKVDREERPDIDSVYMTVCQAFTGSGGWPMSIFMTPDKEPFFAGTYFPLHASYGMPSFKDILNSIALKWNTDRSYLVSSAKSVVSSIKDFQSGKTTAGGENLFEKAYGFFESSFDERYGGFGKAPKFPTPHNLMFLTLYSVHREDAKAFDMAHKTLVKMRRGGIFDQIGYGFSRYSTDPYFLVPHFEKMLYDNALLIMAYTCAWIVSRRNVFLDTAEKTAEYLIREMSLPGGGFYSAQDADSDGAEGKYYVFSMDEIISVLGKERSKEFCEAFGITEQGNFEGKNIPNLLNGSEIDGGFEDEIKILYDYRKKRMRLHLDDKILTSWNSLAIIAMCMLYRATRNGKYLDSALSAQQFIETHLCRERRLYVSFRSGKRSEVGGFLEDYAFYIAALTELYNTLLDESYLSKAEMFCSETVKDFFDGEEGGFFMCRRGQSELFVNPKETYDGALPSGNSVMAYNLVRLYQITEKEEYKDKITSQFDFLGRAAADTPYAHSVFLIAKMLFENPPFHITAVVKDKSETAALSNKSPFLSNVKILNSPEKSYPLINNKTTYYVCKNHSCLPPSNDIDSLL